MDDSFPFCFPECLSYQDHFEPAHRSTGPFLGFCIKSRGGIFFARSSFPLIELLPLLDFAPLRGLEIPPSFLSISSSWPVTP